ncbi:hypothetical protein Tco_1384157 [Tanacetum coccineum]
MLCNSMLESMDDDRANTTSNSPALGNLVIGAKSEDSFYAFATLRESARELSEGDFHRLRIQELKICCFFSCKEKVDQNLSVEDLVIAFNVSYNDYTKRFIQRPLWKISNLGVESYQIETQPSKRSCTVLIRKSVDRAEDAYVLLLMTDLEDSS